MVNSLCNRRWLETNMNTLPHHSSSPCHDDGGGDDDCSAYQNGSNNPSNYGTTAWPVVVFVRLKGCPGSCQVPRTENEAAYSSAFPAIYLGFNIFFGICDRFLFSLYNHSDVTFRLRGWCVLGVFLLLAFIRLGQECQDLLCLLRLHVCTH